METIKSYTDLEQSKKLAEILPIESADSHYEYVLPRLNKLKHVPSIGNPVESLEWFNKGYTTFGKSPVTLDEYCIPCWSLAALLKCLGKIKPQVYTPILFLSEGKWILQFVEYGHGNVCEVSCNNPVDTCYEMILKLHEQKIL